MSISDSSVTVQNGEESSLVVEVMEKQESDPISLELKGAVNNQRVEVFSQGGDGVLRYQGRLCVPNVGELRQHILAEAHNSRVTSTRRQHNSIWVIVVRMTKSSCFLAVKTTYSVDDYAKFYHTEIVKLHGVPLSIISDRGP
ncbi:uncharacterized protein [Solanum lycopersicum]|uniref:uncharacterized protein n=1 Tax=Solanum lycopersicum TaxID=4081 RepID=UPI0037479C8D